MTEAPRRHRDRGLSLLQIKKIGNSVGLILPKELLARLKLKVGDKLYVVEQTGTRNQAHVRMIPSMPRRWRSPGAVSEISQTPTKRWQSERATVADTCHRSRCPCRATGLIRRHADGIRDLGLLESALGRPLQQMRLRADRSRAAWLLPMRFGIARNHPFVDGNKRQPFCVDHRVPRSQWDRLRSCPRKPQAAAMILGLPAGEISEDSLARWIRDNWPCRNRRRKP